MILLDSSKLRLGGSSCRSLEEIEEGLPVVNALRLE